MNAILKIEDWADHHRPAWLDFLRIVLGLVILVKGFLFFEHRIIITDYVLTHTFEYFNFMGAQYTVLISFGGGLLITSGLLTRFASLINLPILIAEVFFVNMPERFTFMNTNLIISVAVLILLIIFAIFGSGSFSAERFIQTHKDIY